MIWEFLMMLAVGLLHCPAMFFWAGCPCCGGCECDYCDITDSFDRANSSTVGTGWTEEAGDWTIASNKLSIADADARLRLNDGGVECGFAATADEVAFCEVTIRATSSGDKARVLPNHNPSGPLQFTAVEFVFGTNKLRLYENIAGAETLVFEKDWTFNTATDYVIRVESIEPNPRLYSFPNALRVEVDGTHAATIPHSCAGGTQFALGTGDTVAGTITFDNFSMGTVCSVGCADNTQCYWPSPTDSAQQMQVVVAGLALDIGAAPCSGATECSSLNGTYVLDRVGQECAWEVDFSDVTCTLVGPDETVSKLRLYWDGESAGCGVATLFMKFIMADGFDFDVVASWVAGGSTDVTELQDATATETPFSIDRCATAGATFVVTPL